MRCLPKACRVHVIVLRRWCAVFVAVALVSGLLSVPVATAASYPSFSFVGFGWGHGIGMSQWGAKGFAERGKSWKWISTYYFPGSYLSTVSEETVVVHLTNDKRYESDWTLAPTQVGKHLIVAGTSGKNDESFTFRYDSASGKVKATGSLGTVISNLSTSSFRIATNASPRTIKVVDPSGYRNLGNRLYRGDLELRESSGKLQLRNVLGMEGYIKGVLPGEVGSAWDMDALKTQAVCARSYAYVSAYHNAAVECDTDSQVYLGYSSENATLNTAVDGTAHTVLRHAKAPSSDNRVIQTFFHSSSGGHTAKIEHIWPGTGYPSTSFPYYGGVDDPYCDDAGSPNDPWPVVTKNGLQVAALIAPKISGEPSGAGSSVWVKSLRFNRFPDSGFVSTVDITWSNGAKSTGVGGYTFANALGLKNRKYYLGVPYNRVAHSDRYTTSVEVSKANYPSGSLPKVAVIASGEDEKYADALTASGLAGAAEGSVLLTHGDALPWSVRAEVARLKSLGATKVYIVGGPKTVPAGVESSLAALMGAGNVVRLAGGARYGTDRYGTAASVAMEMKALGASGASVLVASGQVWTDAAVASASSAGSGRPVVLCGSDRLPQGSINVLQDLGATSSVVFGGPATISNAAIAELCRATGESAPAKRFGTIGDRYTVAAQAAQWCQSSLGYTADIVYVSSGVKFPDSVTGGVLAGRNKHPLVMATADSVPSATTYYLQSAAASCDRLTVVGGPDSLSDACVMTMALMLD